MRRIESRVDPQVGSLIQSAILGWTQEGVKIWKCNEQMEDTAEHADEYAWAVVRL